MPGNIDSLGPLYFASLDLLFFCRSHHHLSMSCYTIVFSGRKNQEQFGFGFEKYVYVYCGKGQSNR
jgi:hypothetical protein